MLPSTIRAPHALLLGDGLDAVFANVGVRPASTARVASCEVSSAQLHRRFEVVVVRTDDTGDTAQQRSRIHCAVQHIERDGYLFVLHDPASAALCAGFREEDLRPIGQMLIDGVQASCFQRGERTTVHDLLYDARSLIARVDAAELHERMSSGNSPLVLDTRTHTDRARFGVIPGSVHVPRTVVEWHLDPCNGYLHPAMQSFDQPIVVVCNGGYSSSLAAANLTQIGFTAVADLIGGHAAWCAAGLPVHLPDHSHLDIPTAEDQPVISAR